MPKKKKAKKVRKKTKKKSKKIKIKKKSITSNLEKELIYRTKKDWVNKALVNKSQYEKKYKSSIKDNDGFWKKEGKRINWIKPYTKIKDVKYSSSDVRIKWFYDGTLNASANAKKGDFMREILNNQAMALSPATWCRSKPGLGYWRYWWFTLTSI